MVEALDGLAYDGDAGVADPLVLLHGFTQDHRSWTAVRHALARPSIAVDAPGHGRSGTLDWPLPRTADVLAGLTHGPATYVGYSMGGRLALHVAVEHPAVVRRLVLVSTTAGLDDAGERAARRSADDALATTIETDGVEAFVDRWLALPLFAGLPDSAADRQARLDNTASGLASSLRRAGTGAQESLWDRLPTIAVPTLVVAGRDDTKFVAIAERLVATIPQAHLEIVGDAGHTVHLEQPERFTAVLGGWLAATDSPPTD